MFSISNQQSAISNLKVALVHDYLYSYGGAERVLEALHEIWPKAPVYTSFVDWQWVLKNKKEWLDWKIVPSWFQKIPFHKTLCSPMRFLAPWIWESFDLREFDVVISSSAWFMPKGVLTSSETTSICYCHTPPRYLYGYPESVKKNFLIKLYAKIVNPFMRRYDNISSERVDYFICNSKNVRKRIKKFYGREAMVIYPPVEMKKPVASSRQPEGANYYLMVNRLVWHKRVDLAIRACRKLKLKLKIVGEGREKRNLEKIAKGDKNIEFLGYVNENKLNELYYGCKAVLYLAEEEDFGITPVEAMSYGKPVVALKSGGIQETVIEGKTGFFVSKPILSELLKVLQKFDDSDHRTIRPNDCIMQAKRFSKERFEREIRKFVKSQ